MVEICKICGAQVRKIYVEKVDAHYFVCDFCEFIFKDPKAYLSEKEEFTRYEEHNNTIEDPRYVAYFKDFIDKAIIPFQKGGKKAFDFGSGPSPVLAMILERDYKYQTEIYDYFYAPEKVYEGKTYDLVTSTEVFEHLADPLGYFTLLAGLMKDDAILAIMTQFHPNNDKVFENWFYKSDPTHISFFTPKTMASMAKIAGFKIIYCDHKKNITFTNTKDILDNSEEGGLKDGN